MRLDKKNIKNIAINSTVKRAKKNYNRIKRHVSSKANPQTAEISRKEYLYAY